MDPFRIHIAPGEAAYAVFSGVALGVAFSIPLPYTILSSIISGGLSGYLLHLAKERMSARREEQLCQFSAASDGVIDNITIVSENPVPDNAGLDSL